MSTLTHPDYKYPLFKGSGGKTGPSLVVLFIIVFVAEVALNRKLASFQSAGSGARAERASRWDPGLFKVVSFGQLPAAIDWMWIQVLLDPDISHVGKGTHPGIYYRLDLISELDPANYEVYHSGANLLTVVRDDAVGARDLLLKGEAFRKGELRRMPPEMRRGIWERSWELPLLLAYVYLFELGDMPRAASQFREAAGLPNAPPYLESLARRLERPGGEYEVGLRLLNFMISGARDGKTRRELTRKRDSLFVGQYLADVNRSFAEYLRSEAGYRASEAISASRMQSYWRGFLRKSRGLGRDPWGGRLSADAEGRVVSTTPHDKVFNLD